MALRVVQLLINQVSRWKGTPYLAPLYREMHEDGKFQGRSWQKNLDEFRTVIPDVEAKTILDFGCGPLGGMAAVFGENVIPFDPFVDRFAALPWDQHLDVVFSSDVLEHMPWRDIRDLLSRIKRSSAEYAYFAISTRRATKSLPNAANAHLLVRRPKWWLRRLRRELRGEFEVTHAAAHLLQREVTLCFRRTSKEAGSCKAA